MISDETLIARVVQQDVTAIEILYDRYAAIVLGILMQMLEDRSAAEDLLQETFWQVWRGAAAYSARHGPFTSWLFRITRRLVTESTALQPQLQEIFRSADVDRAIAPLPDSNQGEL